MKQINRRFPFWDAAFCHVHGRSKAHARFEVVLISIRRLAELGFISFARDETTKEWIAELNFAAIGKY
jgi:hypothetical protein